MESRLEEKRYNHQEPTWHSSALQSIEKTLSTHNSMAGTMSRSSAAAGTAKPLPRSKDQKQVTFELLLPQPQHRARLPMRVMISPHDNTDSIITTVKNFYGLYEGPCVSFQDRDGNILIAAYDNFEHNMTVHVKVTHIEPISQSMTERSPRNSPRNSVSPRKPKLGAAIEMRPPTHPARMTSQVRNRSLSPSSNRSHRSASAAPVGKAKLRTQKSEDSAGYGDNGDVYSDSDGGNGSVTSSRREGHASAEISVDNILEGGRRKRAKFESSVSQRAISDRSSCLHVSGTAAFRTSTGSSHHILVFSVSTKTDQWRCCVAPAILQPANFHIPSANAIATESFKS